MLDHLNTHFTMPLNPFDPSESFATNTAASEEHVEGGNEERSSHSGREAWRLRLIEPARGALSLSGCNAESEPVLYVCAQNPTKLHPSFGELSWRSRYVTLHNHRHGNNQ